jgi:hypothetical protein
LGPDVLFGGAVFVFMAAQLAVILRLPVPPVVPWTAIGMAAAAPVLAAAVLSQLYPSEASGKVNAAIGTLQLGFAFAVQWFIGVALDFWPSDHGRHPVEAYQMAFATILSVQALAFAWFIAPVLRWHLLRDRLVRRHLPRTFLANVPQVMHKPYLAAQHEWRERVANAEIQLQCWRLAALTSLTVCVVLATLVMPQ